MPSWHHVLRKTGLLQPQSTRNRTAPSHAPGLRVGGGSSMGPDTSRWRSSDTYDYLDQLIAPDLAWECLRRNAVYQGDFAESTRSPDATERLAATIQRRWGLRFRDRSDARCDRSDRILGA